MLLGRLYGPADLYFAGEPWKRVAAEHGVSDIANPILSDLAFANLPWRAAVREALANGRFPFWNRFVLGGTPLLATSQPALFHPATWMGLFLPLALSWTFSCTFTIFLSLLCAFLFFRDFRLCGLPGLVGAAGWGFSTYLLFWNGWAVGPSTASFPLLLLGLRRIARRGENAIGLTVAGLLLTVAGGHPESLFHSVAAAGVYFLWELWPEAGARTARNLGAALLAGVLAFFLSGPQLFPLLEAIPHSAEYRARRSFVAAAGSRQSVALRDAAARLLPAALPFAHGVYGKSPVRSELQDGSGMPLAYCGSVLFPLAALGLLGKRGRQERGRGIFLGLLAAGLLLGASAPGITDVLTSLPGFAMALNYRLVFLAALGLSGLAALGAERILREARSRSLAAASAASAAVLGGSFALSRSVFAERGLPGPFLVSGLTFAVGPLLLLAACGLLLPAGRGRPRVAAGLLLLAGQRCLEMEGTYPTLPAATLAPNLPTLSKLPPGGPYRVAASGDVLRPNGAALYGLEDARGYESLVLGRFADTYPLWSRPQFASFNRIDSLSSPFLSFLNVRFAIAPPDAPVPAGWREWARGPEMAILENPRVLPRAFVPRRILSMPDPARTLKAMGQTLDFADTSWVAPASAAEIQNSRAALRLESVGPDLIVTAVAEREVFIATSLPDWPGWKAVSGSDTLPLVTVNHAFVGFWLPAGRRTVRLHYYPASFSLGLAAAALGAAACIALALLARRQEESLSL